MTNPTIAKIIKAYLLENGFTGLCNPDLECGCGLEDLFPCSEVLRDCQAGYKHDDAGPSGDYNYVICLEKPGGENE